MFPNALPDPVLELHGPGGFVTITNNNWRDDPAQEALILATGLAPSNNLESAIDANLSPGAYTAVVRGNNNTTGVALIEVYDLSQAVAAKLANISTRAFVSTGDDIVIAGFILGNQSGNDRIVVRGIGPSLTAFGVPDALANPTLELRDNNGALLIGNNDWQDDPSSSRGIDRCGSGADKPVGVGHSRNAPAGSLHSTARGIEQWNWRWRRGSLRPRRTLAGLRGSFRPKTQAVHPKSIAHTRFPVSLGPNPPCSKKSSK